jgi:hypothetical protein
MRRRIKSTPAEYELLTTRRIVRLAARRSSSYAPVVAAPDAAGVPVIARDCWHLLAGHGDLPAFFGCDEVVGVVGVVAEVDLDPVDPPAER